MLTFVALHPEHRYHSPLHMFHHSCPILALVVLCWLSLPYSDCSWLVLANYHVILAIMLYISHHWWSPQADLMTSIWSRNSIFCYCFTGRILALSWWNPLLMLMPLLPIKPSAFWRYLWMEPYPSITFSAPSCKVLDPRKLIKKGHPWKHDSSPTLWRPRPPYTLIYVCIHLSTT